jgi:hypothetical protein
VDLSIVIPCYDEERRLPRSLEQLHRFIATGFGSSETAVHTLTGQQEAGR